MPKNITNISRNDIKSFISSSERERQSAITKAYLLFEQTLARLPSVEAFQIRDIVSSGKVNLHFVDFDKRDQFIDLQGRIGRQYYLSARVSVDESNQQLLLPRFSCSCGRRTLCAHVVSMLLEATQDEKFLNSLSHFGESLNNSLPEILNIVFTLSLSAKPDQVRSFFLHPMLLDEREQLHFFSAVRINKELQRSDIDSHSLEELSLLKRVQAASSTEVSQERVELTPVGKQGEELFSDLLRDGRIYDSKGQRKLSMARSLRVKMEWLLDDNLQQSARLLFNRKNTVHFFISNCWHFRKEENAVGRVMSDHATPNALRSFLSLNSLDSYSAQMQRISLYNKKHGSEILPMPIPFRSITGIAPVPHLLLVRDFAEPHTPVPKAYFWMQYGEFPVGPLYRRLEEVTRHALYDNKIVSFEEISPQEIIEIKRDKASELQAVERLYSQDFIRTIRYGKEKENLEAPSCLPQGLIDFYELSFLGGSNGWIRCMREVLPHLSRKGFKVRVDVSFPISVETITDWYADAIHRGNQWFETELGISVNNERIDLLPLLLALLKKVKSPAEFKKKYSKQKDIYVEIHQGEFVALPFEMIFRIVQSLFELSSMKGGKLVLSGVRVANLMSELEGTFKWSAPEQIEALKRSIPALLSPSPLLPPPMLRAVLRPYQVIGYSWLYALFQRGISGMLADDMGLGKTVQVLAHLLKCREDLEDKHLPSLVVAPTSTLYNWKREAERFAPSLNTIVIHGSRRTALFKEIQKYDLVITSYHLLVRDRQFYVEKEFLLVLLDEAQNIKNPRSTFAHTARQLSAKQRICLTGTPLENNLSELWSQFHFLLPGFLGNQTQFRRFFQRPIEKDNQRAVQLRLARKISPFILRRTKNEVLHDLPPLTDTDVLLNIESGQRELYEELRLLLEKKVREALRNAGAAESKMIVLECLLRLRQVCCDPSLLPLEITKERAYSSVKRDYLKNILPSLISEGRSTLVFSQFTSMLEIIRGDLEERSIEYSLLTGRTVKREREIERFQRGETAVFLISLKAGGTGLNLTNADTVIMFDPWWNPAVEAQAVGRAHRIGQTKSVHCYNLLTKGTIEEKIRTLQKKKAYLSEQILSQNSFVLSKMTEEQLRYLFSPL